MGIQYPPEKRPKSTPEGGAVWTQAGCLAAFAMCLLFLLGICAIGKIL